MTPLEATRHWFEHAVIGLNLCPFAKAVQARGQIRWVESAARDREALLVDLMQEMQHLAVADPEQVDTTMLVHPQALTDFLDFNDFLDLADAALEELGLDGTLQVASFHPDYRFEGTAADDMGNFSNRSPHPTLQLLREDSVERALAAFPDADRIFEHNIDTLQRLGLHGWQALFPTRS
ncbi:MAG: DUF1415 domain-containing protein [Chitinophagaceae bacterium]|nr:DUF1415 domain-containing protein [Rubrivivax sp.]